MLKTLQLIALQANDLGSNPARYGIFLTEHGLSFPAERLSILNSQQLIMTQTMLRGAQKLKAVMHMPVENKAKPLITVTRLSSYAIMNILITHSFQLHSPLLVIL